MTAAKYIRYCSTGVSDYIVVGWGSQQGVRVGVQQIENVTLSHQAAGVVDGCEGFRGTSTLRGTKALFRDMHVYGHLHKL